VIVEEATQSVQETIAAAQTFARLLRRGDIVALYGDLGSGKTQFVKGACKALHAAASVVSPTFVILHRYEGCDSAGKELLIYHVDLYRIQSPNEIYDLGYEEFFGGEGITFVEWADKLGALLPKRRYEVHCAYGEKENDRTIRIELIEE
jgi:tRNA threonylcarbamoyladenosine biosynthesis protein TsaE